MGIKPAFHFGAGSESEYGPSIEQRGFLCGVLLSLRQPVVSLILEKHDSGPNHFSAPEECILSLVGMY